MHAAGRIPVATLRAQGGQTLCFYLTHTHSLPSLCCRQPPSPLTMADISMKTARFEELWHAWPRSGKKDLSKALQGQVAVLLDEMEDDSAIRLSAVGTHSWTEGGKQGGELPRVRGEAVGQPSHVCSLSHGIKLTSSALSSLQAFNRTGHPMPLSTIYSGEEIRDKGTSLSLPRSLTLCSSSPLRAPYAVQTASSTWWRWRT